MRFLKMLLQREGQASGSRSSPATPVASQTPTCDRCGNDVQFDRPGSGTVVLTFSTPPTTRMLCPSCALDEEKERQWRESGIWVGSDLPPSLRNARAVTPEELRRLLGEDDSP